MYPNGLDNVEAPSLFAKEYYIDFVELSTKENKASARRIGQAGDRGEFDQKVSDDTILWTYKMDSSNDIVTNPKGGLFFKKQVELERVLLEASAIQQIDYVVYSRNVVENIRSLSAVSQGVFLNHFKNMEKEAKKIYLGVYGVYQQDDKVLVIKKARGPYKGKYDLPGGGLNFDETIDQCLDREVIEETNAQVLNKVLIGVNEYQCQYIKEDGVLKDFHHLGIYYKVDLLIKDLKTTADGEDSNGAIFVPLAALDESNTSPIALPMIKESA